LYWGIVGAFAIDVYSDLSPFEKQLNHFDVVVGKVHVPHRKEEAMRVYSIVDLWKIQILETPKVGLIV
jgi:hypothetical protein